MEKHEVGPDLTDVINLVVAMETVAIVVDGGESQEQPSLPPPTKPVPAAPSSTGERSRESTVATSNTTMITTTTSTPHSGHQQQQQQQHVTMESSAMSSYYSNDIMSSSSSSSSSSSDDDVEDDDGALGKIGARGGGVATRKSKHQQQQHEQRRKGRHDDGESSATSSSFCASLEQQQRPLHKQHKGPHSPTTTTSLLPYDRHLMVDPSAALNFAMEHRIFLKAALNLILELDRTAPQLGMMDPVVLKAGSIKKASLLMNGVWKVKYVEVRRGMFSYYENIVSNVGSNYRGTLDRSAAASGSGGGNTGIHDHEMTHGGGELLRKNIPLEASTCTCRAVKLHQKALNFSPSGAIFELTTTITNPRKKNANNANPNSNSSNNNSNNNNNNNSNNNTTGTNSSNVASNNMSTTTIKRLWMATSRVERQAWMNAINNAMVGGSVTRGDTHTDHQYHHIRRTIRTSPYKNDIRKYMKQQAILRSAKVSTEYLYGMRELLNHSLHIPVEWIRKQQQLSHNSNDNIGTSSLQNSISNNNNNNNNASVSSNCAFHECTVELSVDQLRRDLQRDSVNINGTIYRGDSNHSPERIFGALTRCILNVGRGSIEASVMSNDSTSPAQASSSPPLQQQLSSTMADLRESKALAYSRDILLAGNRTRSGGDSYFCVETLCSNADLVVLVPSGKEVQPVEITVSEDDSDDSLHNRFNDKSDWIRTKSKLQRSWRRHFVVLSEGMLSYYEGATPRPHGLRGQQVLADAVISITKKKSKDSGTLIDINHDEFVVSISLKEGNTKDRLLLFESETKLLDWVYALECVTRAKPSHDVTRRSLRRRLSNSELEVSTTVSSMTTILTSAQQATMDHARKLGLDTELVEKRLKNLEHSATCGVRVSVSASTEYKVCTTNPQGDTDQDTWAIIQSHFLQSFRITGGSAGRIMRGEEVVRFSILNCLDPTPTAAATGTEGALSPSSTMRSRINRRIFRNNSADHDFVEHGQPTTGGVSD